MIKTYTKNILWFIKILRRIIKFNQVNIVLTFHHCRMLLIRILIIFKYYQNYLGNYKINRHIRKRLV